MKISKDYFNNLIVPDYVLCKANKEKIGVLNCTEKTADFKFNDLDEIHFTTYLYIDNERNPHYDAVDVMKYILLPNVGFFSIISVDVQSEGTEFECKNITAKSYECLLAQKYLEVFTINMGTVESVDGVQFYNIREPDKSLLHLVLEKCPDWSVNHIDPALMSMQRSFEVSRQDIYSFLNTDIAKAFECFFLFDTLTNTINIYQEQSIGKDTNIHVSYINLLKNTNMSYTTDNIKTCLTITGADDLTVREINMGYDKIYNFDYYNSTEFMSKKLYDAYNKWINLRNSKLSAYTSLLSRYQKYYEEINYISHEKMPSVAESTDWTEYGLEPLKEQKDAYEQKQISSMKSGHGDPSNQFYNSEYLPIYNTLQAITKQIKVVEDQIKSLKAQQTSIHDKMSDIITTVDMRNNFTEYELKELSSYIREDELNSSNYVVTDSMSNDEKYEMLNDLLTFGKNELAKVSVPQISFNANMVNLFAIPEFESFHEDFDPGNYIWVALRDDFAVKAKLLSMHVNFYDPTDFSVTFSNVVRKSRDRCIDIADLIRETSAAASSVSFNSSHWNQSAKETSSIGKILDEGLLAAGKYLKNGDDSEMLIDSRGIFVNTTSGDHAYQDSIYVGGGRILFTSDNWKTVSMSVGRADVTINGITESRFGTFADFVIAGYVGGSILEGSEMIGGTLKSPNYTAGKAGSLIDLTNGTFEFNANNEQKLTLNAEGTLTIKGTIKADKGYIGGSKGFTIESGKLYSSKNSLTASTDGVYIGTDGIALGANNKFKALSDGTLYAEKGYLGGENGFVLETNKIYIGKSSLSDISNGIYLGTDGIALGANNIFSVTPQGYLTAKSGTIGGATIAGDSIHSSNNNWWISSNGAATFKNVTITDNSTFGSNINHPFYGTTIPHIEELAVKQITAENIIATNVLADYITADYLAAHYLDAGTISAKYMEVENWVDAGYIKADRINTDIILAKIASATNVLTQGLTCASLNIKGALNYRNYTWDVKTATLESGITITYLGVSNLSN